MDVNAARIRPLPWVLVALTTLLGFAVSLLLARLDVERKTSEERSRIVAELAAVRARLEGSVKSTFNSTDGLVHLIGIQGGISGELFAEMARLAIGKNAHVRNITIAPDDTVSAVYPLAGNERVLGFRYETNLEQYRTVRLSREREQAILAGPVKLVQGGQAFINRAPVFTQPDTTSGERRYWGTVSIVTYIDSVLEAGDFSSVKGTRIALRGKDGLGAQGEVFAGDAAVFALQPVLMEVPVPGGRWQLGAVPENGWISTAPYASHYFLIGVGNTLLLAWIAGLLALRDQQVRTKNRALVAEMQERRRAEDSLRASQSLLEAIIENAGVVIYVFDNDGQLIACNRGYEKAFDVRREDILGKRRHEFMTSEAAAEYEGKDRLVRTSRAQAVFEELNREADGAHTYYTVKCPIIEEGQVRGVVGISTDITERKHDEEKLRLAAAVLASTAEGVIVTDANGRIVAINRAFSEITGYEEAEVMGLNPRLLKSDRHDTSFYRDLWAALDDSGAWQGEIWNRRKNGELFPEWLTISVIRNEHGDVAHYVGVFSDISSIKHSQAQLEHMAHFDPLTDLPNRILFHDRLAHALARARRYKYSIAVLLLDLDGFKTVNDSLGHPVGDRLLQEVAARLKACVRVEDTVARLGGDEYALILSNLNDGGDAVEVVRKILASVQEPFDLEGTGALVTASVGVAVFPADGDNATDLVRNADAAMYGAKEAGRNVYRFYQAAMTQRAQEKLLQERALRRALERNEFEVWFQPQINLRTGQLTGAEALVRWRDPERGLVPPADFIPLAERTGLVVLLGEQVLEQVCGHARRWLDAGLHFGRLAINVAPPQIERSDFVATLAAALKGDRLPADCLEIEITEGLIMESAVHAQKVLLAIQALGVTTAVDDFGTGYSSLAYLKELPIDNLKIDRAFIKDLPHDVNLIAITRAIIGMGHSLGFKVIAEGIETEAQRDFLKAEGCDEAQGYLFARPLPPQEFENWVRERQVSFPQGTPG